MRTLGLIGGMSWESTIPYYRIINERIRDKLGGLHSAKLVLHSVDFAEIEALQHAGDWLTAGALLAGAARGLRTAGAEAIVVCTNTMHLVAPAIEAAVDIPLLHIADATAERIHAAGLACVALLGTRFTMEQAFYRERIRSDRDCGADARPGAARARASGDLQTNCASDAFSMRRVATIERSCRIWSYAARRA